MFGREAQRVPIVLRCGAGVCKVGERGVDRQVRGDAIGGQDMRWSKPDASQPGRGEVRAEGPLAACRKQVCSRLRNTVSEGLSVATPLFRRTAIECHSPAQPEPKREKLQMKLSAAQPQRLAIFYPAACLRHADRIVFYRPARRLLALCCAVVCR